MLWKSLGAVDPRHILLPFAAKIWNELYAFSKLTISKSYSRCDRNNSRLLNIFPASEDIAVLSAHETSPFFIVPLAVSCAPGAKTVVQDEARQP